MSTAAYLQGGKCKKALLQPLIDQLRTVAGDSVPSTFFKPCLPDGCIKFQYNTFGDIPSGLPVVLHRSRHDLMRAMMSLLEHFFSASHTEMSSDVESSAAPFCPGALRRPSVLLERQQM